MSYALQRKKTLSIVMALQKKDKSWANMVLDDPSLVAEPALANVNGIDDRGWTPLHYAAAMGDDELLQRLLEKGASIEGQGTFGSAPIHVAAQNERLEMVRLLVKSGANVNAVDVGNRTALIEAGRWNQASVARLLLELGADVTVVSAEGLTAEQQSERADGSVAKIIRNR
jgi:ankyrin repeat protein